MGQWFVKFSDSRSYYQDLIMQCRQSKNCGNQTSVLASTLSSKNDSHQTAIDKNKDASITMAETVKVSSEKSASNRYRNKLSVASPVR